MDGSRVTNRSLPHTVCVVILAALTSLPSPMLASHPVGNAASTDEELMLAYVDGDERAFRLLFDRFAPRLHRMLRRRLASDDEARDLVQQTFLRMHAARADFRRDAAVRPWVVTIALNLLRERIRYRLRRPTVDVDKLSLRSDDRTSARYELDQSRALVRAALATLPEAQREVIELHWLEELPFAEVAAIVGATEGAVRVRAHRAYEKLKRALAEERP